LQVRDWSTQAPLPSITTTDYGYWDYSTQDIPVIEVSGNGSDWLAIVSIEARIASALTGIDVSSAIQTATAADVKASEALRLAQVAAEQSGKVTINGVLANTFVLNATTLGARPAGLPISVNEITGVSLVGQTGDYDDLANTPLLGLAGGVATLDDTGKVPSSQLPATIQGAGELRIKQNTDGSWPARTTITSDVTRRVYYEGTTPGPALGTDITMAQYDNRALNIPGDRLRAQGSVPA